MHQKVHFGEASKMFDCLDWSNKILLQDPPSLVHTHIK